MDCGSKTNSMIFPSRSSDRPAKDIVLERAQLDQHIIVIGVSATHLSCLSIWGILKRLRNQCSAESAQFQLGNPRKALPSSRIITYEPSTFFFKFTPYQLVEIQCEALLHYGSFFRLFASFPPPRLPRCRFLLLSLTACSPSLLGIEADTPWSTSIATTSSSSPKSSVT